MRTHVYGGSRRIALHAHDYLCIMSLLFLDLYMAVECFWVFLAYLFRTCIVNMLCGLGMFRFSTLSMSNVLLGTPLFVYCLTLPSEIRSFLWLALPILIGIIIVIKLVDLYYCYNGSKYTAELQVNI